MVIKNVGATDSGLRALLGVIALGASTSVDDPLLAVSAGLMAVVLLSTALFRVCPLYTLLRLNTVRPSAPSRASPRP